MVLYGFEFTGIFKLKVYQPRFYVIKIEIIMDSFRVAEDSVHESAAKSQTRFC